MLVDERVLNKICFCAALKVLRFYMSVCIHEFLGCGWLLLVSFSSSPVMLWEFSSVGDTTLTFSSVMQHRGDSSAPWPREVVVEVGEWGVITAPCPWVKEDEEAGQVSKRSFSTSGKGLTVVKRVWYSPPLEPWLQDVFMLSRSEQLNSEKWLEWESATEGRLPLSDGESSSDELMLRCSSSWASMSSRVSLILVPPPPFLRSLPLLFLPPDVDEEQQVSLAHLAAVPLPSVAAQPLEGQIQPQRPTWLPSSMLLLPLWCRSLLGFESMSTWTSVLFPSLEHSVAGAVK